MIANVAYHTDLLRWTVSVLFPNRKQFVRVNRMSYVTHTLIWLIVSVAFPNNTQFIGGNCMSYIAHTLIWLPVYVVLPHRKQFCWINRMPFIAPATKIWAMFDASIITNSSNGLTVCPESHTQLKPEPCLMAPPSQMFCTFFDGFFYTTVCDYCVAHSFFDGSLIVVSR